MVKKLYAPVGLFFMHLGQMSKRDARLWQESGGWVKSAGGDSYMPVSENGSTIKSEPLRIPDGELSTEPVSQVMLDFYAIQHQIHTLMDKIRNLESYDEIVAAQKYFSGITGANDWFSHHLVTGFTALCLGVIHNDWIPRYLDWVLSGPSQQGECWYSGEYDKLYHHYAREVWVSEDSLTNSSLLIEDHYQGVIFKGVTVKKTGKKEE